jgi:LuxR family maltose regulon positive regulatory protein
MQGTRSRTGLLDRERLLNALDEAVRKRVTIISAPAGSGKTSLLRTWVERAQSTYRVVFLSARSEEDEQLFWLALLAGIQRAFGAAAEEAVPAPTPGFSGDAMLDRVMSELAEHLEPTVLIVDDLHELGSQDAFARVAKLVAKLPAHVHAVLAMRRDLRLGTHQLRLAGELAEIRAENLEFTESETRDLLASSSITLSDEAVHTLQQRTEGWAAGLRLAALSLAVDPDPETFVAHFSGSNRTVADYLLAEMLERQPSHVQRMLLRTSILDRVNGELADLLAESAGSDQTLLALEEANAFVLSLDGQRAWFRYHHLFRELLRFELRRTTPALIPELHRRSARWFTDHGQIIDAIRHTQAAGDWDQAAQQLADHLFSLLMDGHSETIEALLEAFPRPAQADHPELALVNAAVEILQGRFAEAAPHLDLADRHADTLLPERQPALRVGIASLRLGLARRQGNLDDVIDQVNYLSSSDVARWTYGTSFSGDLRAIALMNLGTVEMWSGRLADADRHLREGAALAHKIRQPYTEVTCLANLGFASKIRSFEIARRASEEAVALAERYGWQREATIAPALLTIGGTLVWAGEFSSGEQWLERAASVIIPDTNPPVELLLHLAKGMLFAGRSQLRDALDEFKAAQRMQSLMLGEHALAAQATGWTIATQARLGMLDDARATLANAPPPRARAGEIRNAAAVISLEAGDPNGALVQLQEVVNGRAPIIHDFTLVETHLLTAQAHRSLGDEREAQMAVEKALSVAERERLILPFAMTGARELLEAFPRHTTAHAALSLEILDVLRGSSQRTSTSPVPPVSELSHSELRVLRYLPTNLSRSDIARELYVSVNTVNTHVRNIYSKLGANTRSEAVERARQLRLLSNGHAPKAHVH